MTAMQTRLVGCLSLAVVALFLVGGALFFLVQVPDVKEQLPSSATFLIVTVTTPLNDSRVPLNALTSIQAEALGAKSITALELWADGALIQAKNTPAGSSLNQVSASWTWTPNREGEHMLYVRAIDSDKHVSTSNALRVIATKQANNVAIVEYPPQPGDTVPSVAEGFHTTPQQIVDLNPQLNPTSPIAPGQPISIPVEPPPPPNSPEPAPAEPPSGPTDPPPGKFSQNGFFWIDKNIWGGVFKPVAPAVPTLAGKEDGCNVKLYITDPATNENGFFIYRADAINQSFKRIATLDAHNGNLPFVYVDSSVYGPLAYYVASFNAWGESPSQYIQMEINSPPCALPGWIGLQLHKGKLTSSEKVDKVYCYASVNAGPWTRVPPGPNSFLYPQNGEFDVSQYIKLVVPPQGTVSITLECWGWKGDTLIYLGEASGTFNSQQQSSPIQISASKFQLAGDLAAQLMGAGLPDPNIRPPGSLKSLDTSADCDIYLKDSTAELMCAAALYKGYQVIHWNWASGCFPGTEAVCPLVQDITGFKLYRISPNNPAPTLVQTIDNPKQNVALMPPAYAPPNILIFDQYVVRAYKGLSESADSNSIQVKQGNGIKVTLAPQALTSRHVWEEAKGALGCLITRGHGAPPMSDGQIIAGFTHYYDPATLCWIKSDTFDRGAMWFDIASVPDPVLIATLRYRWVSGEYDPTGKTATNQSMSCGTTLMFGTEEWRNKDYGEGAITIPGQDFLDLGLHTVPRYYDSNALAWVYNPIEVDVTNAVKQWQQGTRPNYGFLLRGYNESFPKANDTCSSIYGSVSLDLVTLPKP